MRFRLCLLLCVALIFGGSSAAFAQISDTALIERVSEAVRQYASFGIFDDINIRVENRAVTLTGRVTMPYKRDDIAERVKKIDGVREFANNVEVLPVSVYDSQLRERLARAIYGNPAFRHYAAMVNPPIHIVVENGRVTLTGAVNNEVERMLAFSLAQLPGILNVKNELKTDRQ